MYKLPTPSVSPHAILRYKVDLGSSRSESKSPWIVRDPWIEAVVLPASNRNIIAQFISFYFLINMRCLKSLISSPQPFCCAQNYIDLPDTLMTVLGTEVQTCFFSTRVGWRVHRLTRRSCATAMKLVMNWISTFPKVYNCVVYFQISPHWISNSRL